MRTIIFFSKYMESWFPYPDHVTIFGNVTLSNVCCSGHGILTYSLLRVRIYDVFLKSLYIWKYCRKKSNFTRTDVTLVTPLCHTFYSTTSFNASEFDSCALDVEIWSWVNYQQPSQVTQPRLEAHSIFVWRLTYFQFKECPLVPKQLVFPFFRLTKQPLEVFYQKMFSKILQNPQENTCARVSF